MHDHVVHAQAVHTITMHALAMHAYAARPCTGHTNTGCSLLVHARTARVNNVHVVTVPEDAINDLACFAHPMHRENFFPPVRMEKSAKGRHLNVLKFK